MTRARLWAVTAYFNPRGYRTRRTNYDVFQRALNVPLLTVELASAHGFDLTNEQADVLVQIPHGDLMWQKERLLNVALERLPRECDTVVWLDCDVVFASERWVDDVERELDRAALVQVFDELVHLRPDERADAAAPPEQTSRRRSFGSAWGARALPHDFFRYARTSADYRCNCGMGWAARRDLIARHGFYDTMVLGMGDKLLAAAAVGQIEDGVASMEMSLAHARHYRRWAERFHSDVAGRVGAVGGSLAHLWHGDLANRRYAERYNGFASFNFDPELDLRADPSGAWRWGRSRPDLRRHVENYFVGRREDGGDAVDLRIAAAV
jgi:hypothetical protein